MIPETAINPFTPGAGLIPPFFPGRQEAKRHFKALINRMSQGHPPAKDTILCAPRGNGKTALLAWFESEHYRVAVDILVDGASVLSLIAPPLP